MHHSHPKEKFGNNIIEYFKKLIPKGGFAIDIGAHVGDTAIPMGLAVGENGLVHAFECNPTTYKFLKYNVQINKLKIVPVLKAVGDRNEKMIFNYSDAGYNNGGYLSSLESKKPLSGHCYELEVDGVTLNDYLKENKIEKNTLDFLKIDCEGYDIKILENIFKDNIKPSIIQFELYPFLSDQERSRFRNIFIENNYKLSKLIKNNNKWEFVDCKFEDLYQGNENSLDFLAIKC